MKPIPTYSSLELSLFLALLLAACAPSTGAPPSPTAGIPEKATVTVPLPPRETPTPTLPPTLTPGLSSFAFPTNIDPKVRYLFYLHGKIIEDQGLPAISPEYGQYRYIEILETLQNYGFDVISEQRAKDADAEAYARRVVAQVEVLLDSGVPSGSITIVGASKGAAIAMVISDLLAEPEANYVLLGACNATTTTELVQQGVLLSGNVLAISDSSDEYAGSCEDLFAMSEGQRLTRYAEIILQIGTGHGILYAPLREWVVPTVKWASQE